ncbi:RHS repeat domain-containing protein [Solidesulfovibrio sp.]|uniref:RHS repeat domain-containing protein n=1 Tax=Solidesulfovibrio sp. TaxID=2910990 RepID=UPI002B200D23|nr:RHS repeat domain-containing protein [Solidesulfovibrio sp.]MEA4855006.1 RHS repeat domain-containing protein [Solidesulfovibrio sp.]
MDLIRQKRHSSRLVCVILFVVTMLSPASLLATNVSFTYDAAGRLLGAQYTDNQAVSYGYDAVGNMTQLVSYGKGTNASLIPVLFLMILDDSSQ